MSFKLDKAYLAVNFPKEVAEVGTNWAKSEKSLETQKTVALEFLPERVNKILEDIKRAAAENKTSCSSWVSFNGHEYNKTWENAFKSIFRKTLKVTIHDSDIRRSPFTIDASWEPQQNRTIKRILEIGQSPMRRHEENEKLNTFRKGRTHKYCDFTFLVKDTEFPVHKVVLAKSSLFFDQMFSSAFREGASGSEPSKFGPDSLEPEMFEEFLEYIYIGMIDFTGKDINYAIELAALAHMTEVQSLVDICHSYLRQSIGEDNFYLIVRHAAVMEEPQLVESCKTFVTQNPNSTDKMDLSKMTPQELIGCYNIARLLASEKLIQRTLTQIGTAMNKDTFHAFCQGASSARNEELKEVIKKACHKFATANKELLLSEPMKDARELYTKLMTGL